MMEYQEFSIRAPRNPGEGWLASVYFDVEQDMKWNSFVDFMSALIWVNDHMGLFNLQNDKVAEITGRIHIQSDANV